ncbi:MAG TPA: class II aldolase/adducin family protein [Candidatus Binatia bacterium]|jgi:L-ribulose-5-phosphate 4-epimerase
MASADTDITTLKNLVIVSSKMLYAPNQITEVPMEFSQGGHVSVRLPDGDRFLIAAYIRRDGRTFLNDLTPEDVLTVDLNGKPVESGMKPVGEVVIHSWIYKSRPEIKSVIHVHPFWATTLSIAGKQILPVGTSFGHYFPDGVPLLDTGFGWLVIEEHGEQIVKAMGSTNVLVHKGHGIVVAGDSVEETVVKSVALEQLAQQQAYANMLGTPKPYTRQEMEAYYAHTGDRMWASSPRARWLWYERRLKEKGLI